MPQCLIETRRQANRFDDLASVGVGGVSFRSQAARRDQVASDLKRRLPCLIAYRTRGIVVLSTAVTSVVATVGISIMAVPDCVIRCGTRRGLNPVTSPGACRVRALSVGGQADAAIPPQSRGKPFGSGYLA